MLIAVVFVAVLLFKTDNAVAFAPGSSLSLQRRAATKFQDRGRDHLGLPFVTGHGSKPARTTELAMGLEEFLTGRDDKARKADNDKYLAKLQTRVDKINALESDIEDLDDDELVAKTREFQERLKKGEDINGELLEEAFAVVREASW